MLNIAERVAEPVERQQLQLPGMRLAPFVTSDESNGVMSVIETRVEPAGSSPTLVCKNYAKAVYVVSGCFDFQLGTELRRVGTGGFVTIPHGVLHGFRNVGVTTGILLTTITPGGYEDFLHDFAMLARDEFVGLVAMRDLCDRYEIEIVGA